MPVTISIAKTTAGDILIHNNAPYDVDLSGYTLAGTGKIVFPPHSIIASRGTVTVPGGRVASIYSEGVTLRDASHLSVATWPLPVVSEAVATKPTGAVSAGTNIGEPIAYTIPATGQFVFADTSVIETGSTSTPPIPLALAPTGSLVDARSETETIPTSSPVWPYVGLALIISLATVGVVVSRPKSYSNLSEI